jgi:hypothetical protein
MTQYDKLTKDRSGLGKALTLERIYGQKKKDMVSAYMWLFIGAVFATIGLHRLYLKQWKLAAIEIPVFIILLIVAATTSLSWCFPLWFFGLFAEIILMFKSVRVSNAKLYQKLQLDFMF